MRRSCAIITAALARFAIGIALCLVALGAQADPPAYAGKHARSERRTQKRAEALRAQADAEQLKGHTATALQLLEEAFDLHPDPELLLQIGQCHQQMGNAGRAAFSYRQYLLRTEKIENRGDVEELAARMEALAEAARTDGMIPLATQTRKHP